MYSFTFDQCSHLSPFNVVRAGVGICNVLCWPLLLIWVVILDRISIIYIVVWSLFCRTRDLHFSIFRYQELEEDLGVTISPLLLEIEEIEAIRTCLVECKIHDSSLTWNTFSSTIALTNLNSVIGSLLPDKRPCKYEQNLIVLLLQNWFVARVVFGRKYTSTRKFAAPMFQIDSRKYFSLIPQRNPKNVEILQSLFLNRWARILSNSRCLEWGGVIVVLCVTILTSIVFFQEL